MRFKKSQKTLVILFLVFTLLSIYEVHAQSSKTVKAPTTTQPTKESVNNSGSTSIQTIEKLFAENTPDFIAKPIVSAANAVEKFRSSMALASKNKKVEVQNELKILDREEKAGAETSTTAKIKSDVSSKLIMKPFKNVELFILTIFSFIFNNKIAFYGFSAAILLFFLHYFWSLIF